MAGSPTSLPRFLALAFLLGGGLSAQVPAGPDELQLPLTKAIQIRSLSHEEAVRALPVRIRGTVIFIASRQDVFVQDDTAGTFFQTKQPDGIKPGDIVEVEGVTKGGLYLPGIELAPYRVLGHGPLPEAVRVTYDDLRSGRFHYQRVAVEGVVRACTRQPNGQVSLKIGASLPWVEVRIEPAPSRNLDALVGAEIRAEGLAAGSINPRRQLVQPYLQVGNWDDITVLQPAIPAAEVPKVSAGQLLTFRVLGSKDNRVRIDGVVTASLPDGLVCLRQGESAFAVRLADPVDVGDRIEVAGFPEMGRFSATLMDAVLLQREPGGAPEPAQVKLPGLLEGRHDYDLVEVAEALVTDAFRAPDGLVLTVQDGGDRVQVRAGSVTADVEPGSLVRIRGISVVERSGASRYTTRAQEVTLHVRTPGDLVVLQSPSWWTARRLWAGVAVLVAVVLLAGLWITLLRRQVSRQTAALRARIESEAALQERQRIARQFHDTLEQELAGLRLRLDAAATREIDEKGRGLLAGSRNLVSRIQAETRNLILDLRSSTEIAGDLAAALHDLVAKHAGVAETTVTLRGAESLPVLPAAVVHHVRMMVAEGVTNALKHAGATAIDVTVESAHSPLCVVVTDNGRGFNVAVETNGKSGHFGCIGIRERARKLNALVTWTSAPGEGTRFSIEVPDVAVAGARTKTHVRVEPAGVI